MAPPPLLSSCLLRYLGTRTDIAGRLSAPGPGSPAVVLMAGARVAGTQNPATNVASFVPGTPTRVMLLPKHGRGEFSQVPAPG